MKKKKVVIALGGNALGKNVEEQKEAVAKTAKVIVDLASQGLDIIITHGNGPQVGMIQDAMDSLVVQHENYKQVPLPTCVAMSQGYIGIDLQNAIKYELYSRGIDGKVSTILSQVEVDEQDPAFQNPTKPIGRFLTKEEAEKNMAHGISCMEDAGRGYRIVVPSGRWYRQDISLSPVAAGEFRWYPEMAVWRALMQLLIKTMPAACWQRSWMQIIW